MIPTVIGYAVYLGFIAAAAGPFVCLLIMVRRYGTGAALPEKGAAVIYWGCVCWIGILAARSALAPAVRPWIGLPLLIGLVFGPLWHRRQTPPAGVGSVVSSAAVFFFFGLLGLVALGGGYFDKMFQIPHAIEALRKTGVKTDDAGALARALRDDDVWVRWGAALSLERLGDRAAPALDALVAAVEDPDPQVGHFAWNSIRRLGPLAAPAAPALAALLKKGTAEWQVQQYFESLGPKCEAAVPTLLALTEDSSAKVRAQALEALGSVGPGAKAAALPFLARMYKNERDAAVKDAFSRAQSRLGVTFSEWQQAISRPP
ncbi:MAG: HEAT repeat domain-containing protein [Elusimicrobia bacterium]|nr:HEAT repeat domain-containing protein [Elusimicrobiota bacterium]